MKLKVARERLLENSAAGVALTFPYVPNGEEWDVILVCGLVNTGIPPAADVQLVLYHEDIDGVDIPICVGRWQSDIGLASGGCWAVNFIPPRAYTVKPGERLVIRDSAAGNVGIGAGMVFDRITGRDL